MRALLIGNSDGIGLATTRRLLYRGWDVVGISRSQSTVIDKKYHHYILDVTDNNYPEQVQKISDKEPLDLCIYFAGIGELLDPLDMGGEARIIDVNLSGMVKTASAVIPGMVRRKQGHFMGISSFADELLSSEAPSYHASKAGFSNYLGGLALAMKPTGVNITNVRFGFVDTKMAKGEIKPFMMNVDKAVDHLEACIRKKPIRYSAPRMAIPLIKFRKLMMNLVR
ncbi:MAG: SDR family NAD(P)-dependent oxidoreductase [Calditrichaeota bacterium]|nr:SDR family NAD(P)-dependent oxidoreductase [Calditrichota bacterium]RQW05801.1 MAG: SDR family NAD(P)-dependent oxidoreductase [Calditrichota bacterium]